MNHPNHFAVQISRVLVCLAVAFLLLLIGAGNLPADEKTVQNSAVDATAPNAKQMALLKQFVKELVPITDRKSVV